MTEVTPHHPAGALIEAKLRQFGLTFEYVEDLPLADTRIDPAVQVRHAGVIAPGARVKRYHQQMAAGAEFPPIVVRSGDYALLDGNTRVQAAGRLGRVGLPAYLVDSPANPLARRLAAALNQLGGEDLQEQDLRRAAISAKSHGESDAWIAREFGVDYTKVRRWVAQEQGREHAERVRLEPEFESLSETQKARLAEVSRDQPFAALVRACATRRAPAQGLRDLVKAVQGAGSDEDAVRIVEETVSAWPALNEGDRRTSTPVALAAKMPVGALLAKPVEDWVDMRVRDDMLPRWVELRDRAEAIIRAYNAGV